MNLLSLTISPRTVTSIFVKTISRLCEGTRRWSLAQQWEVLHCHRGHHWNLIRLSQNSQSHMGKWYGDPHAHFDTEAYLFHINPCLASFPFRSSIWARHSAHTTPSFRSLMNFLFYYPTFICWWPSNCLSKTRWNTKYWVVLPFEVPTLELTFVNRPEVTPKIVVAIL